MRTKRPFRTSATLSILAMFLSVGCQSDARRIQMTKWVLYEWSAKLSEQVTDGQFRHRADPQLPAKDHWDNNLIVEYARVDDDFGVTDPLDSMTIRSAGPDGKLFTSDDMTYTITTT